MTLTTIEPSYPDRRTPSATDKYAFKLSALLKTEAAKSRKQRRTLKQLHEDLKGLGFEGSYDPVAAFARVWRAGQTDRGNAASKRTVLRLIAQRGGFLARKSDGEPGVKAIWKGLTKIQLVAEALREIHSAYD